MSKPKKARIPAGAEPGLGDTRYRLICAVAQRAREASHSGYHLEATTLIESLLSERLEKRAQYLHTHPIDGSAPDLSLLKDGFANLGPLLKGLLKVETDRDLRADMQAIDLWRADRNQVVHEMAKLGTGSRDSWEQRYARAREVAERGVPLLLAYDLHERRVCHEARQQRFASATCPDALAPLGQPPCEWCLPPQQPSGEEL